MSDNIPFEIQIEIIKRVPVDVKSLIRFRSVSKPWMAFIDSPEFVACFGVRNTQPHRLLLRYRDNLDEVKYISFIDDVTFPQQQQDFAPNVPLLIKQLYKSKVIGSSCGLWCLHGFNSSGTQEMLVIWSPSIRKSVGIVMPPVHKSSPGNVKVTTLGFGVCPSTYDPTIVKMSYIYGCLDHTDKWQVDVFSLSSKTWKMIPSSNMPRESIRVKPSTQVATNRFIFWVACDTIATNDGVSEYKSLILSFDLITQEFQEINLPHSLENLWSLSFSISKLSESLVVSIYTDEAKNLVYGVWMMGEEGGVMPSFTKLFNIKTPDDSLVSKILGFTMSGELITETEKNFGVFAKVKVYKPCSEHINDLGINGAHGSFFIFPYTETLLLVDHSDCCIISNDS